METIQVERHLFLALPVMFREDDHVCVGINGEPDGYLA